MKTKIHAAAGAIGFLTILIFWTSSVYAELFASFEAVAAVKSMILKGMIILIPAMAIAGASGMSLGGKRVDAKAVAKKKRMPFIAANGLLILVPSAYFLESKASVGDFDTVFYFIQTLELFAGATNLVLLGLNIRDGLIMTGRIGKSAEVEELAPDTPTIEARDGGPLVAKNLQRLTGSNGKDIEIKPVMALCRCGASANKPFCDGSHNEIGFDGNPSADRTADKLDSYTGDNITIHYNKLLCSHAGECGKRLKPVFDSSRKPWIAPNNASNEEIISIVELCPSGALSYSIDGQPLQHQIDDASGITVEKNGPFRVSRTKLVSANFAEGACPEKYVLCRCGRSSNLPFCDGTHHDTKWREDQRKDS